MTGEISSHAAHAVVLATGGYGNVFFLSTNAMACNVTAAGGPTAGRAVRQPVLHPDPPHLHPRGRRVPVEAHPHVRIAAQRRPHLGAQEPRRRPRRPPTSPRPSATTTSSDKYPSVRQPRASRRRVTQRQDRLSTRVCRRRPAQERRVPRLRRRHRPPRRRTYPREVRQPLRHVRAHHRRGPVPGPMRIYPATHYTMGGLWVDYN